MTDFVYVYTNHPSLTPWLESTVGMTAWPVFNVADVALIAGVVLFGLHQALWAEEDPDLDPA